MSTASQTATLQAVRTRLLAYTPPGGSSGTTLLGTRAGAAADGKLYIDQAPDDVTDPYGVLRIADWRSEGDDGGFARRLEIELQLRTRPRSAAAALKLIADQFERALRSWADTTAGVIVSRQGLTRSTVFFEAPADREVVLERLLIPMYVHAQYLTQDSA